MQHRRLYRLGVATSKTEYTERWPYGVDYEPAKIERPFLLWEGIGPTEVGGEFSAKEILASQVYSEHLKLAGVEWLYPYLQRLADGETVSEEEILAAYIQRYQCKPEIILLPAYE